MFPCANGEVMKMVGEIIESPELACRLIGPELAARKANITEELLAHVEETVERENAFSFRLPASEPWPQRVFEFVAAERQCCPFFTFDVRFEPNDGPLWL